MNGEREREGEGVNYLAIVFTYFFYYRMCCNMSDNLAAVLDVPRHPKYSVSHRTAVIYYITAVIINI